MTDLPVDELAFHILADLGDPRPGGLDPIAENYLLDYRNDTYRAAYHAVAEALGWLYSHDLVVDVPNQMGQRFLRVTRLGSEVLKDGLRLAHATARMDVDLHPRLGRRIRTQFLIGEHSTAALIAMREVEIALRQVTNAPDEKVGAKLARWALHDGGPLADPTMETGEHDARAHLFAGAIGFLKNPNSHREVHYDDPTEASEVILLADLLLRIIDRAAATAQDQASAED